MAVFETMLMIRYVPGWVLDGGIAVDVEEEDDGVEEVVEDMIEETELDLCCEDPESLLFLCAAESPPPTPPPIAPPNTTRWFCGRVVVGVWWQFRSVMVVRRVFCSSWGCNFQASLGRLIPGVWYESVHN
jgi:hypothetical protein